MSAKTAISSTVCVELSIRTSHLIEIECIGYIERKYLLPLIRCPSIEIENTRCCGGECLLCMPIVDKWEVYHFAQVKKRNIDRTFNQDIIDLFMPHIESKLEQYGEMDSENDQCTSDEDDGDDEVDNEEDEEDEGVDYEEEVRANTVRVNVTCDHNSRESNYNDSSIHDSSSYQNNSIVGGNNDIYKEYNSDLEDDYTYYCESNMYGGLDTDNKKYNCCKSCDNNKLKRINNESNTIDLNKKVKYE